MSDPTVTPRALVTGAGSGIGAATVHRLVKAGYTVVAVDRRFADDDGDALAGSGVTRVIADLSRPEECRAAALSAGGRLDVLVNCAAVRPAAALTDTTVQDFHNALDVNVIGAFAVLHAAVPALSEAVGTVVNVSSGAAYGKRKLAAYGASKSALISLSKTAAIELAPLGIRVNVLLPGTTDTQMLAAAVDSTARVSGSPRNLGGAVLSAEDVADEVFWLASSSKVTGAVVPVGLLPWEW